MTKEEKIKEAWGEYYSDVIDFMNENGGVYAGHIERGIPYILDCVNLEKISPLEYRPKLLKGIENNNGWIKIESEDDLPKEIIECRTCFYDGRNYVEGVIKKRSPEELSRLKYINEITHYQPIIKPEPPIF